VGSCSGWRPRLSGVGDRAHLSRSLTPITDCRALLRHLYLLGMRGELGAAPQAAHEQNQDCADEGRKQHDVVEPFGAEPRLKVTLDDRIGGDDLADDPAQQRGAGPHQDRKGVEQRDDQRGAATISGMLMARPITSSAMLPWAAAAIAITLSRLMMMSAMATIRTARQRCSVASVSSSSGSSGTSSLAAM